MVTSVKSNNSIGVDKFSNSFVQGAVFEILDFGFDGTFHGFPYFLTTVGKLYLKSILIIGNVKPHGSFNDYCREQVEQNDSYDDAFYTIFDNCRGKRISINYVAKDKSTIMELNFIN